MSEVVIAQLWCGHFITYTAAWGTNLNSAFEECDECDGELCAIQYEWISQFHSVCSVCGFHKRHRYSRKYADASASRHQRQTGHRTSVRFYNDAPADARAGIAGKTVLGMPLTDTPLPDFTKPPSF